MRSHISVQRATTKYFSNSFIFKNKIEKEGLPRDRTPDLGAGGPRFKSGRPDHSSIEIPWPAGSEAHKPSQVQIREPEQHLERANLEFEMEAQCGHKHRSSVAVIAGIVDVLKPEGRINAAPDMKRVIRFDDVFAAVIEPAVS
jgi:hypothetical protein